MDGTKIKLERIADLGEDLLKAYEDGDIDQFVDAVFEEMVEPKLFKLYKHTVKYDNTDTGIGYAYFVSTRSEPYTAADMYATAPKEAFISWAGPYVKVTSIMQSGPSTISVYGVNQNGSGASTAIGTAFVSDTVTDYE